MQDVKSSNAAETESELSNTYSQKILLLPIDLLQEYILSYAHTTLTFIGLSSFQRAQAEPLMSRSYDNVAGW